MDRRGGFEAGRGHFFRVCRRLRPLAMGSETLWRIAFIEAGFRRSGFGLFRRCAVRLMVPLYRTQHFAGYAGGRQYDTFYLRNHLVKGRCCVGHGLDTS
ncbi:MAG: hypothetical protein RLZZ232_2102 [Planctomycetota bacterium]